MLDDIHEVIGFDLGHSGTAIALVNVENQAEPELLEAIKGKKKMATAVARHPTKGVVIGEVAVRLPGAEGLRIGFKRRPPGDPAFQETLQEYVQAVVQSLLDNSAIRADRQYHYYVGCPAGWREKERQFYEQLLHVPAVQQLVVVPESRAAFMHTHEQESLSPEELKGSVLVIDIGSSTTDFTLVRGKDETAIDFGENAADLGGTLIDKAILEYSLANDPNRAEMRSVLAEHPHFLSRCELLCRAAKERYFSEPEVYDDPDIEVSVGEESFQRRYPFNFRPLVSRHSIDEILAQPLSALDGHSWPEHFRMQLCAAQQKLAAGGTSPTAIVLTGGASRMQFVEDVVQEVFSDVRLHRGSEPELAIARGLARWGRIDIRTRRFENDVQKLIEEELPGLIQRKKSELIIATADGIAGMLCALTLAGIERWRAGQLATLGELEQTLTREAADFIAGPGAHAVILSAANAWAGKIAEALQPKITDIAVKHKLLPGTLQLAGGDYLQANQLPKLKVADSAALLDSVSNAIFGITAAIIALVIGISATIGGPLAWILGGVVWVVAGSVISDAAQNKLKTAKLSRGLRNRLLPSNKAQSLIAEKRGEMKKDLQTTLEKDQRIVTAITEGITRELKANLQAQLDRARLLLT